MFTAANLKWILTANALHFVTSAVAMNPDDYTTTSVGRILLSAMLLQMYYQKGEGYAMENF